MEEKIDDLKSAYKDFDLDRLLRMAALNLILLIINHEQKAEAFLDGAIATCKEVFSNFKTSNIYQGEIIVIFPKKH